MPCCQIMIQSDLVKYFHQRLKHIWSEELMWLVYIRVEWLKHITFNNCSGANISHPIAFTLQTVTRQNHNAKLLCTTVYPQLGHQCEVIATSQGFTIIHWLQYSDGCYQLTLSCNSNYVGQFTHFKTYEDYNFGQLQEVTH